MPRTPRSDSLAAPGEGKESRAADRAFELPLDRREAKNDLLVVILSRAFMFAVLFGVGSSMGIEGASAQILWVYGCFIVLFLGLYAFTPGYPRRNPVGLLLFLQFLVEILAETTILVMAGGYASDYGLLFLLTIISAAYFFRIWGALTLAAAASLVFGTVGFAHLGHPLLIDWITVPPLGLEAVQVRYFLYTTLFFLIAFLTTQWTRRLDRIRSRLEGAEEALDLARFSAEGMMQDLPSGILFFDATGRLRYWNRLADSLLGGKLHDGEALLALLGGVLPPPYLAQILAAREFQVPEGCDAVGPLGQPLRIWLKPLVREGQYLGCLFTLLDLTEEKRFEAALQRRQRMSALGEMSARIAHEIRNPLAAIFGASQMLEGSENLGESDRRLMALITSESRRLNQFLRDLLEFVKDRPPAWRRVMASEILEKTCDVLKNSERAGAASRVESELPAGDFSLVTDRDLILQVLLNIGLNGLEAMGEAGGTLTLSMRPQEEKVEIRVEDTGPGMDAETLARVYDPFFTTKEAGTGLGLAVCQHTVQTLEGNIMLQSSPGSGTLVNITLPREPASEEENKG